MSPIEITCAWRDDRLTEENRRKVLKQIEDAARFAKKCECKAMDADVKSLDVYNHQFFANVRCGCSKTRFALPDAYVDRFAN